MFYYTDLHFKAGRLRKMTGFSIGCKFPSLLDADRARCVINVLTVFFPISSHIFKTLNTISTKSICCDHTINTICVVFTQYAVSYHVSKMLTFSFHSSLLKTKIMNLFSLIYKCLNTACQKLRPNISNLKYSIKLLLLQQQQLKSIQKNLSI